MLLPGVRQLASVDAPLRIATQPSARPEDAPRVTLGQDAQGKAQLSADIRDFGIQVEILTRGRWLTVLELRADVRAQLALQVVGGKLALQVTGAQIPKLEVMNDSLVQHADITGVAPAVAQVAVSLLLAKPLALDLDLDALLTQALALPLSVEVVGIEVGGNANDWLMLGMTLTDKPAGAP